MTEPYIPHFQNKEDQIESAAYLIWRRFERLGLPNDVLNIQLSPRFLGSTSESDLEQVDRSELFKEKIFRNFTNDDMALIQLGKIVALKEGGLLDPQTDYYIKLRDYFLGAAVVLDYYDSLSGNSDYDFGEIIEVAHSPYFSNVIGGLEDINFLWGITQPLRELRKSGSTEPPIKPPSDKEIPPPSGARSYDAIMEMTKETITKIDEMLLSKM